MKKKVRDRFSAQLLEIVRLAQDAHDHHPSAPDKSTRKWDGRTPYWTHPVWCGLAILHEPGLPEDLRRRGALALSLHDLLEDTTVPLPRALAADVQSLVRQMTFPGGSAQERAEIWSRPPEVRLLKLYDKTCNLLDDRFMKRECRRLSRIYVRRLAKDVEAHYPGTNIVTLARSLCRLT